MKKLRLIFTLCVVVAAGMATIPQRSHAQLNLYFFDISQVDASNGQFLGTSALAGATEKQLKTAAANASTNGVAVLIGSGSTGPTDPVKDIQIVGIGGVAYGDITTCAESPEER
jgi:hypothetical protein